ncbi:MAG: guanine deaminase [Gammaproteobacteria bacterium]|nr:guanine deaminase [Gammaproteobacteria bacterium]
MHVHGTLIHAPARGDLEILERALVTVGVDGNIAAVEAAPDRGRLAALRVDATFVELAAGQYLLPGLIDLHVHAPQWPQLGKALHLPLNEWLRRCTFPLEAKYADLDFARTSYASLVDGLLANGTTTATYFGTVHLEATKVLARIAADKGQRAYVGKVAMDNADECPDYYRDRSARSGLDETRAFIEYVNALGNELVRPVVTPRFIPSCTDEMLSGLGKIAAEYGCHVQTHCSESDWEHRYVLDRHGMKDTQSLDRFGLLTDQTILAHAILIDDEDMAMIGSRQSGIAHCPLSNLYLSHAVFPARKALDRGLKVGLGTDIAGGASPSILQNCQVAVTASRALEDGVDPTQSSDRRGTAGARIDFREAFWMATAGGAEALGLAAGRFEAGCSFDAIVLDTTVADSNLAIWPGMDTAEDVLQKAIYNAGPRNISKVWVQGREVRG